MCFISSPDTSGSFHEKLEPSTNGFSHAYVRDSAVNFHVTQIPWANFGTVAESINDAGSTAGTVTLPAPSH